VQQAFPAHSFVGPFRVCHSPQSHRPLQENARVFSLSFSDVCPEPVLAK
jgi:hypothetical protein